MEQGKWQEKLKIIETANRIGYIAQ